MKRMQLQLPANESGKVKSAVVGGAEQQRTPTKKKPEYKSPQPYKYLNQKMFQKTDMHSSGKEDADVDGFNLQL